MMVSTKGRYALRLMVDIANQGKPGTLVSMRVAAERLGLSVKYMEQLGGALVRAGVLKSMRGVTGGYYLNRPASEISVGEIFRGSEGTNILVPDLEDAEKCAQHEGVEAATFWRGLCDAMYVYMDKMTLADVVAFGKGK